MPRSPLPRRDGLDASWVRSPDNVPGREHPWATMADFLRHRLPPHADVDGRFASGGFVDAAGRPWQADDPYRPNAMVWFHRGRTPEPPVPFDIEVLFADERIVVVDKPHFLATTPRGSHVTESVVAKLRTRPGFSDATPAHRLDRLTAGVLLLTLHPRWRSDYAGLFASGAAQKTYEAIAPRRADLALPRTVTGRIVKNRGRLQAELVDGEPNSSTFVELDEARGDLGRYRLTPATGKTHQLRLHLCSLGIPIVGDPLYPQVRDVADDDFSAPLRLVARRLRFVDPVDGTHRDYASGVRLDWPDATSVAG